MSYTPTQTGDVVLPANISQYLAAELPDQLAYTASGAASLQFEALAQMGGNTVGLRKFKPDTTEATMDDGSDDNGAKLESLQDQIVIQRKRRTRGVDSAVRASLGTAEQDSVMIEIARQSTYYWLRQMENSAISILKALFDGTSGVLRTTNRLVYAAASGQRKYLEYGVVVDAATLHGDNMERLSIMVTGAKTFADLKKQQAAKVTTELLKDGYGELIRDEMGRPVSATYFDGKRVVLSDQFAATADTNPIHSTFLVRPGAIAFAIQKAMETKLSYLALKNSDVIVQPLAYGAHVLGCKWNGSVTPSSTQAGPTNTNLEDPTAWTKVDDAKNIGIIQIKTNATN